MHTKDLLRSGCRAARCDEHIRAAGPVGLVLVREGGYGTCR
jgi:hypothetical protein